MLWRPWSYPRTQGWEVILPLFPIIILTGAPGCELWLPWACLLGNSCRNAKMCNFSSSPSLHTAPHSQPGGHKGNCHDGIISVRLTNPPSHKTEKQSSLAFLVTFLAWQMERQCRRSYIHGCIANWNISDLRLWDPRRCCSVLTSCRWKSSASPGSSWLLPHPPTCSTNLKLSAAIKGNSKVGMTETEKDNCKGFK